MRPDAPLWGRKSLDTQGALLRPERRFRGQTGLLEARGSWPWGPMCALLTPEKSMRLEKPSWGTVSPSDSRVSPTDKVTLLKPEEPFKPDGLLQGAMSPFEAR